MKVVILAGGYGTRFSEYTDTIPKPLIEIGGEPIAVHIMRRYAKYGFKDFVFALGYKADKFREYFASYKARNSNMSIDLGTGEIKYLDEKNFLDWKISLIDTGRDTMTGGRIKKLSDLLDDTFMLTYGDGVSNVQIDKLLDFHFKNKKRLQ